MAVFIRVLGDKATKTKCCRVEGLVDWRIEYRPGRGWDRDTTKGHVGHTSGEGGYSAMSKETRITASMEGELGVVVVAAQVLTGGRDLSGIC